MSTWGCSDLEFKQPHVNAWIRERQISHQLTETVCFLKDHWPGDFKATIPAGFRAVELSAEIYKWGASISIELMPLVKDLCLLVADFYAITEAKKSVIHLKLIKDQACSKFHVDAFRYRMITSYTGSGTWFVENSNVRRYKLGTENSLIIRDWDRIIKTRAGQVALMKGETAAFNMGNGVVHCSPEVLENAGERIVLRIDEIG